MCRSRVRVCSTSSSIFGRKIPPGADFSIFSAAKQHVLKKVLKCQMTKNKAGEPVLIACEVLFEQFSFSGR